MVRITARYDGKVLIPDGPLTLPRDVSIEIMVPGDAAADSNGNGNGVASGVLRLAGLGADAWAGVDAVEYQRREREGWE